MPVLESNNNAEAEVPLQGSGDVCIMNIITANCPQKNTLISCPAAKGDSQLVTTRMTIQPVLL